MAPSSTYYKQESYEGEKMTYLATSRQMIKVWQRKKKQNRRITVLVNVSTHPQRILQEHGQASMS